MNNRKVVFGPLLLLGLVLLVACQAKGSSEGDATQTLNLVITTRQIEASLNLVSLADLDQTARIEVLRRDNGSDSTSAYFEELFTITDMETIRTMVASLNKEINLRPPAQCPALYTLVFYLTDGRQLEFGYACDMASPSFLRGGQVYWQGQDVIAPDTFNRVLNIKLNEADSLENALQQ